MFSKILIANRGEIAVRIIRTCREMGIRTIAVYSEADENSLHVKLADEACPIGPSEATQSYLNTEKILEVAEKTGAEALHPGYGFLAENPQFVEMCEDRGVVFIGPPANCMYKAKPKHNARQLMRRIEIPVVPGYDEVLVDSTAERLALIQEIAEDIGYPVIVKPSGGGGGIGMTVAKNREELVKVIDLVQNRGRKLFGVSSFYVEKFLTGIKHIEFQVIADKYGNMINLGERDCSIQRRFQKLMEETPCSTLSPHLRMKMAVAAIDIAMALQYVNALTVEFFYLPDTQKFYFNEVNTRLQVEHSVTELATRVDIVREQIRIAAGEQLSYTQDEISLSAHALQCRINSEDPSRGFLPCPGTINHLQLPHGLGLRIDEGIYEGYQIPFHYDSLLLKLMAWGKTREEVILRMKRGLNETKIDGIVTTIPFYQIALDDEAFWTGEYTTDFIEKRDIMHKVRERMKRLGG